MKVFQEEMIRKNINVSKAYERLRQGFIAHSQNKTTSSISHIQLHKGSIHIKGGMKEGDPHVFIKLASGFSENWRLGIPTGDGCILGFSSFTGQLEILLLDRGYLTQLRTGMAARLCIETFQPQKVESVGILGTGEQARFCARQQYLATRCRNILVWGRNPERLHAFKIEMEAESVQVTVVDTANELLEKCDLVITTTSSREPLLSKTSRMRTKLIVALGADETGKQELDSELVASAHLLIADDLNQSAKIGEFQHGVRLAKIKRESIHELGTMLANKAGPSEHLVICDLSGLPIQDAQIASAVLD